MAESGEEIAGGVSAACNRSNTRRRWRNGWREMAGEKPEISINGGNINNGVMAGWREKRKYQLAAAASRNGENGMA